MVTPYELGFATVMQKSGMVKTAVTLDQLRKANQALKNSGNNRLIRRRVGQKLTPDGAEIDEIRPLRRNPRHELDRDMIPMGPIAVDPNPGQKALDLGPAQVNEQMSRLYGGGPAIFTRGDSGAFIEDVMMSNPDAFPSVGRITGGAISPKGREALNRSILQHEASELAKHPGQRRMLSHLSTKPAFQDLNIAATLEGPGSDAAQALRDLRQPEVGLLEALIPGAERLNLGEQRLSRHAIRRLQEIYDRRVPEVLGDLYAENPLFAKVR